MFPAISKIVRLQPTIKQNRQAEVCRFIYIPLPVAIGGLQQIKP